MSKQRMLQVREDGIFELPSGKFLIPPDKSNEFAEAWRHGQDQFFGGQNFLSSDRVFVGRVVASDPAGR